MTFQYDDATTRTFSAATLAAISNELTKLAEEFSIEKHPAEHRTHLGISIIGDNCARKIWYSFRWVKLIQFSGRMRRLFNKGHLEEEHFKEMLSWMGFFVREIDPNTNKQYKFSALNGHYGGSSDSLALLPWLRGEEDRILVEYKTHNKKSFDDLIKKKLKVSKPKHFAQMSGYGKAFNVKYGLYCAYNKDDSDYYFELIELDYQFAQQLENKALDIITAKFPPQRISNNPDFFECKYCEYSGICHKGEPVEKNCRSCKYAAPIENAQWFCNRFTQIIPNDFIAQGCEYHVSVNI